MESDGQAAKASASRRVKSRSRAAPASAALQPSLIRRLFEANEHAEGWTTMLEDYMLDIGLMGELTDEARFGAKLDISRIGAAFTHTGESRMSRCIEEGNNTFVCFYMVGTDMLGNAARFTSSHLG